MHHLPLLRRLLRDKKRTSAVGCAFQSGGRGKYFNFRQSPLFCRLSQRFIIGTVVLFHQNQGVFRERFNVRIIVVETNKLRKNIVAKQATNCEEKLR